MLHAPPAIRPEGVPLHTETESTASRWLRRLAALFILTFGLLPIVNWIPGGRAAPWYGLVLQDWLSGSLVVILSGTALAVLTRRWVPEFRTARRLLGWAAEHPVATGATLAAVAFAVYATLAHLVFSATPLHLDELAQVIQARIFASGRLFVDPGPHPEFRSALHMLDAGGRWFSQFPPGGPLLLVPGVWLGAPWLVGPALGAASVALCWSVVRRIEGTGVALGATAIFTVSPFVAAMSATHMNHVGALCCALLATWALARLHEAPGGSRPFALLLGASLGMLGTIRPVDAMAVAVPAGTWILARARADRRRWTEVAAAAVGIAVPLALLLAYNQHTTGRPLLFAYEALWGPGHGLGFHAAPWGQAHTPQLGVELLSLYLLRLQTYFLESPVPALLLVVAGLALRRISDIVTRYWLYSALLLALLYATYWHDGFYLGPRFLFLWSPFLALMAARGMQAMATMSGNAHVRRGTWWGGMVCLGVALGINLPMRFDQYRAGLGIMRLDPTGPAKAASVENALIFVRESWGAQLVPRLWALGVSRPLTELLYRSIDTCTLDQAIGELERNRSDGVPAEASLVALMRDSSRLVPSEWSPDRSERVLPGRPYEAPCVRRIAEDRGGFTIFAPVLARDWGSNVYARELHDRDSLLLQAYPDRPVYLLRTDGPAPGAPLVLVPLSRDSMVAEWR